MKGIVTFHKNGSLHGWCALLHHVGLMDTHDGCLLGIRNKHDPLCLEHGGDKMSAFVTCKVTFQDKETILTALGELGYNDTETHTEAVPLHGYQGDSRAQRAHVIVRREHIAAGSNDLGFEQQADGSYRMHISSFDTKGGISHKHGQRDFRHTFAQVYAVKKLQAEVAKKRYRLDIPQDWRNRILAGEDIQARVHVQQFSL